MAILEASQKVEYRKMRFAASLKGVDLDSASGKKKSFADVVRDAEEKAGLATGPRDEGFSGLGIEVEESN